MYGVDYDVRQIDRHAFKNNDCWAEFGSLRRYYRFGARSHTEQRFAAMLPESLKTERFTSAVSGNTYEVHAPMEQQKQYMEQEISNGIRYYL